MWGIIYQFSNFELTHNNLGSSFLFFGNEYEFFDRTFEWYILWINCVQNWVFFSFGTYEENQIFGTIGSFFSILVTGCPACSITLASYFGLS